MRIMSALTQCATQSGPEAPLRAFEISCGHRTMRFSVCKLVNGSHDLAVLETGRTRRNFSAKHRASRRRRGLIVAVANALHLYSTRHLSSMRSARQIGDASASASACAASSVSTWIFRMTRREVKEFTAGRTGL